MPTQADPTEPIRRLMVQAINSDPGSREALEARYEKVWDTAEMSAEFTAVGFSAPLVVVRRKADGVKGSLMFQHAPRFYFSFSPHNA